MPKLMQPAKELYSLRRLKLRHRECDEKKRRRRVSLVCSVSFRLSASPCVMSFTYQIKQQIIARWGGVPYAGKVSSAGLGKEREQSEGVIPTTLAF
jgi:hypothetical protein